jgi:hypothetical protein
VSARREMVKVVTSIAKYANDEQILNVCGVNSLGLFGNITDNM